MSGLDAPCRALRSWLEPLRPRWGVVLGSGLGRVAQSLGDPRVIPMAEIPGFPVPAVAGHGGKVWSGRWGKGSVLIFEGRPHLYEGWDIEEVTRPVRIMRRLGVRRVILTNAAGSLDPSFPPGGLVRACDLIPLLFRPVEEDRSAMRGNALDALDADLGRRIDAAARALGIDLRRGILAGVFGPAYETASEVRLLRRAGADLAGMSTVPEAFAARQAGLRVAVVSLVANLATGIGDGRRLDHGDVVARAGEGAADLARLLRTTIGGGR